ncbi:hypothetical protein H5410_062386 [Solanum commersonii]|uniref:Uncharacterized protein n=1 Tax=Solanum commersonii TaxID=4109 RepID=A0A9J5WBF0_SOLCO|nr:hypothetical protein H5410_062386 [Solanum commersonii]
MHYHKDVMPGYELWNDRLICAFEYEAFVQRTNMDDLLDSTSLVELRDQDIFPADDKMDNKSSSR